MLRSLFSALICITAPMLLLTEQRLPYTPPLRINNGFSSSFQEFRSNHFHAGVDLRTFQKTGFPVYAIADGTVNKIRIVWRGSGRGVYIQHEDGNSSAYFHLQRFAAGLEKLLEQEQTKQNNKYIGDLILEKPVPVKKGELIAYSGESGYGFPHLHLEIRDADNVALNPFFWIRFPGNDTNPPVMKRILLRSVNDSQINGHVGEHSIILRKIRSKEYVASRRVVVTGPADLLLNAYDVSDTGKQVAPFETSMFIDNRHIYNLRFERFHRDDNNQLGFVYDMFYTTPSSYFINLFNQPGFDLEDRKTDIHDLLRNLTPGPHELLLAVQDNGGNRSTALIPLMKMEIPELRIERVEFNESRIEIRIHRLSAPGCSRILMKVRDTSERIQFTGDLDNLMIEEPRSLVLNGIHRQGAFLDFEFIYPESMIFNRRVILNEEIIHGISDFAADYYINRDEIYFHCRHSSIGTENIRLRWQHGENSGVVVGRPDAGGVCFLLKPAITGAPLKVSFDLLFNHRVVKEFQREYTIVVVNPQEAQVFRNGCFEAVFAENSVRERRLLLLSEPDLSSDYPVVAAPVRLEPFHFPFLDRVDYSFRLDGTVENPGQLGIYRHQPQQKQWRYVHTESDGNHLIFKTRIISSGTFALLRDVFPPSIYLARPASRVHGKLRYLVLRIRDKGEGIDKDGIKVWLNGIEVAGEYDPDWAHVVISTTGRLKRGVNSLKTIVTDRAGNQAERSFRLTLQ